MEETQSKLSQATAGLRDNLSCPQSYCSNKHEFFITIIDGLLKNQEIGKSWGGLLYNQYG